MTITWTKRLNIVHAEQAGVGGAGCSAAKRSDASARSAAYEGEPAQRALLALQPTNGSTSMTSMPKAQRTSFGRDAVEILDAAETLRLQPAFRVSTMRSAS